MGIRSLKSVTMVLRRVRFVPRTVLNKLIHLCGDGTVDDPEGCDDGNTVTEECEYGLASCTVCAADCTQQAGDTDLCGDGTVDAPEACDDSGESVTCNSDCTWASCGDGVVNSTFGEGCDGGGETATCNVDCTAAVCGDGQVNTSAGETCDDGNTVTEECEYGLASCTVCAADCMAKMGDTDVCGDGTVDGPEACDDGAESSTCNADCTVAACGDGVVNGTSGETCDDEGESIDCDANCTAAVCGWH